MYWIDPVHALDRGAVNKYLLCRQHIESFLNKTSLFKKKDITEFNGMKKVRAEC